MIEKYLGRIQAFEFHERNECPQFLRDGLIEILGRGVRWGQIFDPVVPFFIEFCKRSGCNDFLDLCSGSGEPIAALLDGINRYEPDIRLHFTISDLFPKVHAMNRVASWFPDQVRVITEPLDATKVSPEADRSGRTIINAFHHFPPSIAFEMIADCVNKRKAIFISECFPRELVRILSIAMPLFTAFLANPVLTENERFLKTFFSFAIPVIPLVGLWDCLVSVLRIHSKDDLMAMASRAGGNYEWEYREIPFSKFGLAPIFWGIPK